MNDWISMKDRTPELGQRVLLTDGKIMEVGYLSKWSGLWYGTDSKALRIQRPTHWMMPVLP